MLIENRTVAYAKYLEFMKQSCPNAVVVTIDYFDTYRENYIKTKLARSEDIRNYVNTISHGMCVMDYLKSLDAPKGGNLCWMSTYQKFITTKQCAISYEVFKQLSLWYKVLYLETSK
jgi:hypothetical protein